MLELLKSLPQELSVILIAALPVFELRGAIPYAIGVLQMKPLEALGWSLLGNILPALIILYFLGHLQVFLENNLPVSRQWFNWLYNRSTKRGQLIEKYGHLGLMLFVAVPAPMTGAYTGCIVAFLLRICPRRAVCAVLAGILLAGIIVTLAVTGALMAFRHLI